MLFPSFALSDLCAYIQRRMHYHKPPDVQDGVPSTSAIPHGYLATMAVGHHPNPYIHDPAASATNDFRERFHRPLIAPSPFRSGILSTPPQHSSVSSSMTQVQTPQTSRSPTLESSSPEGPLDPQLGHGRDDSAESKRGD